MASVSLKRLIVKNKDTHQVFQQLLNLSAERIGVKDVRGDIILGADIKNAQNETAITLGNETLGWVYGGEQSVVLAGLLSHYAIKENERKTLGQEVLTMYREINVIYDFSEKLAKTIDPRIIANLTLEEAIHLINISGGVFITKSQNGQLNLELLSSTGKKLIEEKELNTTNFPFAQIDKFSSAEIINTVKSESKYAMLDDSIESLIYAPLKVKENILGLVILYNERVDAYKASDLKLLTTLTLQAASALESALLSRKVIEEVKAREESLKRVDKLKDEFLANTSHELRTPLNGIIGLSESLYDRTSENENKEDLSMIITSGRRLANLVNDILDFSKLKNFDIEIQRKPVDLHALTEIVLRINAPLVAGKSLSLENHIPADLQAVLGDENRLQQILNNLIGNAIKFTQTGYVKITAARQKKMVRVSVKDTGIGIPANKQEIVFQEFQQADGSISREFAGTGLGLSISKRLVELHNGKMWFDSIEGKGTTFYFSLPISEEKAIPPGALSLSKVEADSRLEKNPAVEIKELNTQNVGNGKINHILIVDDEPINHQVLKNHLSSGDYQITMAMNGEDAMKALENGNEYDLVLLDVMMPRMNGYEVCQKIREKFMPSELPVIMVTAKNQVQDLVHGLKIGANDYLAKPFSKQELLARIKTQLDLNKIFNTVGRFVPNEFIKSLGKERITDVNLGDQAHRNVTVLFTDIRGYTTISEQMTPEENFNFINAYNLRMGPIIQKNHGFVNQYLGDAILALFPSKPVDALRSAIEIQQKLAVYNEDRVHKGRLPINIGIGLHTGELIMGITGDDHRMDAAIISDTVNSASRVESLSKYYGANILLSEDSINELDDTSAFNFRYLGKVQVKGKNNSLKIYECFDGDGKEIIAKKSASLQSFNEGMMHYFEKDFAMAALGFQKVVKENPGDFTAKLFLQKSGQYIASGVPQDWDGVEVMSSK
jgi:signal transduction histidine kinase/class 3 adenylate cyclase/CheY-like chemotaxis protein